MWHEIWSPLHHLEEWKLDNEYKILGKLWEHDHIEAVLHE